MGTLGDAFGSKLEVEEKLATKLVTFVLPK